MIHDDPWSNWLNGLVVDRMDRQTSVNKISLLTGSLKFWHSSSSKVTISLMIQYDFNECIQYSTAKFLWACRDAYEVRTVYCLSKFLSSIFWMKVTPALVTVKLLQLSWSFHPRHYLHHCAIAGWLNATGWHGGDQSKDLPDGSSITRHGDSHETKPLMVQIWDLKTDQSWDHMISHESSVEFISWRHGNTMETQHANTTLLIIM